jgi:protein-S-isoprenylcysteine O-methyltransferase Ste14
MPTIIRSAIKLMIGIVIFAGLPLFSWGVKDTPGFFDHPARLVYTVLIVLMQFFIVIKLPEAGSRRGSGKKSSLRERLILMFLQVIPLAIVIIAPYGDHRNIAVFGKVEILRYVGLGVFFLGFTIMHWAEAVLDKQFSIVVTIQENHQLVTAGPYRYLRHPRYLGIVLFSLGFSCIYRSWLALILAAGLTMLLIGRIHIEEMLLHREFGPDWEAYSQKTWRLIPFIY